MEYLLDTHTLLWFLEDDVQLSARVKTEIGNIANKCYVSIASLWEITIKMSIGKLSIGFPFEKFIDYLSGYDIELLPITFEHLVQLSQLSMAHRDPFDRLIIAQGQTDKLTIITRDEHFAGYAVPILW